MINSSMAGAIAIAIAAAAPGSAPALGAPMTEQLRIQETSFDLFEHRLAPLDFAVRARSSNTGERRARAESKPPQATLSRRAQMLLAVRAAELRHRIPAGLLDAVIMAESAYSPWAVSRAGAAGLAQLMPATAAELGVLNRFDPGQSIDGGARYLRRMLDRFGSVSLALAAYNAGPGAVLKAGGIPYNGETAGYVVQVLRHWSSPWPD